MNPVYIAVNVSIQSDFDYVLNQKFVTVKVRWVNKSLLPETYSQRHVHACTESIEVTKPYVISSSTDFDGVKAMFFSQLPDDLRKEFLKKFNQSAEYFKGHGGDDLNKINPKPDFVELYESLTGKTLNLEEVEKHRMKDLEYEKAFEALNALPVVGRPCAITDPEAALRFEFLRQQQLI